MRSLCSSYVYLYFIVMVLLITLIAKGKSLAPYQPKCSQNICQNLPSHLNFPTCHQEACNNSANISQKRTDFCLDGCNNFKKAIEDNPVDGCSMFCNVTQLENSFAWKNDVERLPILSCVYGCEKAMKNFVSHILSEIQNIVPPQVLRKNGHHSYNNETSETITFGKNIENDISGKLIAIGDI